MIEFTFLKELILIKPIHQKIVIFVTIGIFLNDGFKFQPNVFNGCHDVLMISMNLSNITIWNINSAYYHCITTGISKSDAINTQNINLTEKSRALWKIKKSLSHIRMVKGIITFGHIEIEKHK